jgi:hypothetical protein
MNKDEELESLIRFVNAVLHNDQPDPDAMVAGMKACTDKIKSLNNTEGAPKRGRPYLNSDEFSVALMYYRKEIRYSKALAKLMEVTGKGERTAKTLLKEMEPRAKEWIEISPTLDSLNGAKND